MYSQPTQAGSGANHAETAGQTAASPLAGQTPPPFPASDPPFPLALLLPFPRSPEGPPASLPLGTGATANVHPATAAANATATLIRPSADRSTSERRAFEPGGAIGHLQGETRTILTLVAALPGAA